MALHNILLVEDSYADAKLFLYMLEDSKINCAVHIATDGLDAMDFLLQRGKHVNAIRPDLILLDLNLPRKDGRQVLKEIKQHPLLRQIPVLIQSTSTAEEDVYASYDSHANGYLVKPMNLEEMSLQLKRIEEFFLLELRLPKEKESPLLRKLHNKKLASYQKNEHTSAC